MSQGFIIGLRHRSKSFLQKVNADDWIEFIMIINKFKTLLKNCTQNLINPKFLI